MKILTLHCDFIRFKPVHKAIKEAESVEKKETEVKDALVVLTAVEKSDEDKPAAIVDGLIANIKEIAKKVKTKKVVLYPYAHLSASLASPKTAMQILKDAAKKLRKSFKVTAAPFGWYKQFNIQCKGHPLSELSREITVEEKRKIKRERKKGSEFCKLILVDSEGNEYAITRKNWKKSKIWQKEDPSYKRMYIFVRNELEGAKEKEKPKHITYMRKLELVDYCPESDVGNYKWYPKGMLIRNLILAYQEKLAREFGAFNIQNPLIYRLSVPAINSLLGEFHERDYSWEEGKEKLVLRFASDPGAFPYIQKIHFSYKDMPLKEYEEAMCFRKEQKGEVKGLRRVRNFLMTDLHVFCSNMKQVKEQFVELCIICKRLMNGIIAKGRWVLGWEGTLDFYKKNKRWLIEIGKGMNVPAFFKLMRKRSHYYDIKNEFQSVESDEATTQISTVQIDTINGKRFDICYVDEKSKRKPCLIIHCSTFGSIERTLCAILENAAIDEAEGKKPMLPFWLNPTQVRIIPISEKYNTESVDIAKDLNEKENIRADVDDRPLHVEKKIFEAEQEWIPYIICIGKKELEKQILTVRNRKTGKIEEIKPHDLKKILKEEQADMPWKPLPLPMLLSKRPRFV